MSWVLILLIWLVAPFAELGIIIWLLVMNDKYKGRIRELEMRGPGARAFRRTRPEWAPQERSDLYRQPEMEPEGQTDGRFEPGTEPESQPGVWHEPEQCSEPEPDWQQGAEPGTQTGWQQSPEYEAQTAGQQGMRNEPETARGQNPGREAQTTLCQGPGQELPQRLVEYGRSHLGMLSLILGVVFIILAGLIFATTAWHILPDTYKVFFVLACAGLFFGASFMAESRLHIHRTGNAFYILGSIFLFLSILAAAYFELLGADFILAGRNRWKVLWVGSVVTVMAFLKGLKRFHDKLYTQASLWGMSLSLFFMAKAFAIGWNGFLSVMMMYSFLLVLIKEYLGEYEASEEEHGCFRLLSEGFRSFVPIHFLTFTVLTLWHGTFAVLRLWSEEFTALGLGAMGAMLAGSYVTERNKPNNSYSWLKTLAAAETVLYAAGWMTDDPVYEMAAVNLAFLIIQGIRYLKKEITPAHHSLGLDICGCGALVLTLISFYMDREGRWISLVLCLAAFAGYYLWFYLGSRQWPHLVAAIGILPLPYIAKAAMGLTMNQLGFGVGGLLLLSGALARCFYPIAQQDEGVEGQWRMDWLQIFSIWTILFMAAMGDARWRFGYMLLAALYVLQYGAIKSLKKAAYAASACFLALAWWQQPFIQWPKALELEMALLPAAMVLGVAGALWEDTAWVLAVRRTGYVICLLLLCADALISGMVWDALILEGICLCIFLWAQVKTYVWWGRLAACIILGVALFMTRSFWLSVSWWVYLLAAGIGLMIFAGFMENKK